MTLSIHHEPARSCIDIQGFLPAPRKITLYTKQFVVVVIALLWGMTNMVMVCRAQTINPAPQYSIGVYPNSGSTIGGANDFILPTGLSTSDIDSILSTPGVTVTLDPGASPVPFSNSNHNPVHDNNMVVPADPWNVRASGAACDAQIITGAITQGSTTLTASSPVFTTAINDGATWIETTGTDPSTGEQIRFDATLTYVSSTVATLSTPAPFSGSAASFIFGHNDYTALSDAISVGITTGRQINLPVGTCWSQQPLQFGANIVGQGSQEGGLAGNAQSSVFVGSAGEDVFQALDPSVPGYTSFPRWLNTGNYTIAMNPTIDATKPWEICGPTSSCTQQTPLYRPIGILGPDAQNPLAPQWIEGSGPYNSGATNGVAQVTNGSNSFTVATGETPPSVGEQVVFPYLSTIFSGTVASVSGQVVTLGSGQNYPGATATGPPYMAAQEWFAGTSFQNIQTAIPATGRTFPMTITLANPIVPSPTYPAPGSPAGLAPFGYVQIDGEQCAYYGNSNYPASPSSSPTITLQACAQNGTTAAAHSVGAIIVPLNPLEPSWPWPVTPTVTVGAQTPENAEFFPAQGVGNAAISFPVANGADWVGDANMYEGRVHDILITINGGSITPNPGDTGYQVQNDTAAMYIVSAPFASTFDNIKITDTFYGIVEGTPSINTHNYFGTYPTADGNHWTNIVDQSSALPMDIITEGSGMFTGLQFFSQSYAPPNNYIPGFVIGSASGGQGNLMLDAPYDDQASTYPYGNIGVQYTTFNFKYLETEFGFFQTTQPLDYWNCFNCTWYNPTPKSTGVHFITGGFQQFYGGVIIANSTAPIVLTGFHDTFEHVGGIGSSYLGSAYGSSAVLNWGADNVAYGPGDNTSGTVGGPPIPQVAGNDFAPITGQTEDTLATGNITAPYVAKGLGYFSPEQLNASTALDPGPMTGGWTYDPTSPISNSYATCAGGPGGSCNPAHMNGDYVWIGPGGRLVAGQYYGHISLKTPQGAQAIQFALSANTSSTCTGGWFYYADFTTADANWHDYTIPVENLAPYSGCTFSPVFSGDGTHSFDIEVGYVDLIPLPNELDTASVVLRGSTSGTATLGVSATGGTLDMGSTNATVTSAGALTVTSCTGCSAVTSVFGRTGAVTAAIGDYTAAQVTNAAATNAANTYTQAGAASAPAASYTGAPYSGGTGTTTVPLFYLNDGTAPTTWSTAGTEFGINAPSGFTGNLFDFHVNGGSSVFSVNDAGVVVGASSAEFTGSVVGGKFKTQVNCASSASPASCSSAGSGSVAVPTGGTTLVVDTSEVTASSQIQLTFDSSLGSLLSVTCNTTVNQPTVSARTAGTSFTITMENTVSTDPGCIGFTIIN